MLEVARQALARWVREGEGAGREFLQLHLREEASGFAIRHAGDRDRAPDELEPFSDPFRAREIAQTTAEGAHRPLKTAPNLRRGWRFEGLDEGGLWTALDYLYPACALHWHQERVGQLRVTPWGATANRQSGIYSAVRLLPPAAVRDAVRACCDDAVCLRRVVWTPDAGGAGIVPCPEACSLFVSFARTVLELERRPPSDAREGDFEHPENRRRLRYLAIRERL